MFKIPNSPDAAFPDQAEPDSRDFGVLATAAGGTGVITGCAVTAQGTPDMTVAVAAGTVSVDGAVATVTAGNLTIGANSSGNSRFDLICVDSSGTKSVVAGTAAANPVFPDPVGKAVLAAVLVPTGVTAITNNHINDKSVPPARKEQKRQVNTLAVDVKITEPYVTTVMSGTVVPERSVLDVTVNVAASSYGTARNILRLLIGNVTPQGELQQAVQYSPPKAGVQNIYLGKLGWEAIEGILTRRVRLTGLTPGATYSWRLQAAPIGGLLSYQAPAGSQPGKLVMLPDDSKAYINLVANGELLVFSPQPSNPLALFFDHSYALNDTGKYKITSPPLYDIDGCALPNSSKVCFCDYVDGFLRIIDVATDQVERSVTGAAFAGPRSVDAQNNTTVWFTRFGTLAGIYPVTVATGAVGSVVQLNAANDTLTEIVIDQVNNIAYVGCTSPNRIFKISGLGTTNTVTSITPANGCACLELSKDGTLLFAGFNGGGGVKVYNTSDLSAVSGGQMNHPLGNGTKVVTDLTRSAQGGILWVGWDDGHADYYSISNREGANQLWNWIDGIDAGTGNTCIGVNSSDYIYVACLSSALVYIFPGAQFWCSPLGTNAERNLGPDFYQEHAEIVWEGVA